MWIRLREAVGWAVAGLFVITALALAEADVLPSPQILPFTLVGICGVALGGYVIRRDLLVKWVAAFLFAVAVYSMWPDWWPPYETAMVSLAVPEGMPNRVSESPQTWIGPFGVEIRLVRIVTCALLFGFASGIGSLSARSQSLGVRVMAGVTQALAVAISLPVFLLGLYYAVGFGARVVPVWGFGGFLVGAAVGGAIPGFIAGALAGQLRSSLLSRSQRERTLT